MQPTSPPWRVLEAANPEGPGAERARANAEPASARPPLFAVLAVGAAGVLLVAAFVLASQAGHGTVEIRTASATGSPATPSRSATPMLVVEVTGAVTRPGVYSLASGARIGDAIAAAGGYGPRVDAAAAGRALNLAALVRDGDQIRVPSRDDPEPVGTHGPTAPGRGGSTGLVDVNRASATELEALPGIGPATAAKIVAARADQPFRSVDELLERKLVSSKVLEAIRGLVTAG